MAEFMRVRVTWSGGEQTDHSYLGLAGDRVAYEVTSDERPSRRAVAEFANEIRKQNHIKYAGLKGVRRTLLDRPFEVLERANV